VSPPRALRIGTRGSQLALWQASTVKTLLERRGHAVELVIIKTSGDRASERASAGVAPPAAPPRDAAADVGKRLFVKEIEDAMLQGEVDLAVHSAKDMPAALPGGLGVTAVLPREDPRDALVLPRSAPANGDAEEILKQLGPEARLGTSSIRRMAQLRGVAPRAHFAPVRGNVDTRLRKLDEGRSHGGNGGYDALILAAAGLNRLGLGGRISALLPPELCTPAPGQGVIAIETREDDGGTRRAVAPLNDEDTAAALEAERALVGALGGGCQLPLGGLAVLTRDGQLSLAAVVISPDAQRVLRRRLTGEIAVPSTLGRRVADALLKDGAGAILDSVRAGAQGAP
jgi:hydroxymethylbilane synthase